MDSDPLKFHSYEVSDRCFNAANTHTHHLGHLTHHRATGRFVSVVLMFLFNSVVFYLSYQLGSQE